MPGYFDRPIFILGLPRSGTSMIAGALKISGAWAGTTVPGGGTANPKGFFEHIVLREHIIKRVLRETGCDPLGVSKLPPTNLRFETPNLENVIREIIKLDGYRFDRPWLYKDVKLTLLWPLFVAAFPSATWVIVRREPRDIVNSCLRTSFMKQHSTDTSYWENFIKEYLLRISLLKATGARLLEVQSEDVISGKLDGLQSMITQLGLVFDKEALVDFISPDFWHKASPLANDSHV